MNITNQINIFIVDDNKVFAMALKAEIETFFKDMPLRVRLFETGENCMERILTVPRIQPQVVILDYHLNSKYPEALDGVAVLDGIKEKSPETNVIMLTGDDSIDIAIKAFQHGASDYVVKTESKFEKIIFSLFNIFKMIEEKRKSRKYKFLIFLLLVLLGGVMAIRIFSH